MGSRLTRIAVALVLVLIVVYLWRGLLLLAAGIASISVAVYLWQEWKRWQSIRRFRAVWAPRGKDLLIVYSNSPNWQRYVEDTWLPRWGARAVVLNWSERTTWDQAARPEVALFRAHAGNTEFNPLAIVVPPTGSEAHVVRFWRAFRDAKHGKDRLLRDAEARLDEYLRSSPEPVNGRHT